MVRQFNDGEFLFGSDLEHFVSAQTCVALNNFLNSKKTTVDSGYLFTTVPFVHYGYTAGMNMDTANSTVGQLNTTPFAYGSQFTYLDDKMGSYEGSFGNVVVSGNSINVSSTMQGINSETIYAEFSSGSMDLGIGSLFYAQYTANISVTSTGTGIIGIALSDGTQYDLRRTLQAGNGATTETVVGAFKITSSTNARFFNFVTGTTTDYNITGITFPCRARFYHSENETAAGINRVTCTGTFTNIAHGNTTNYGQYFQSTAQTTIANSKAAVLWPNVYTINNSNDILLGNNFKYDVSSDGGVTYVGSVISGLDVAQTNSTGSTLTYRIYLDHITGSPVWVDSWAAMYDANVSHTHSD